MNSTNWFNHDATNAYQNDLYRAAENERLANEAQEHSAVRAVKATFAAQKQAQKPGEKLVQQHA
mgnify:CR=1 FL=1